VSIIKEIRPEDRKISFEFDVVQEKKTFLGLQVGDVHQDIYKKIAPLGLHSINVDERTLSMFMGRSTQNVIVSKVNENYALIVKVVPTRMTYDEHHEVTRNYIIDFVIDVDYFVVGTDDSNKTFIHYLDSEPNKHVRIHPAHDEIWTHDSFNYFINENPDSFNKYKELDLNLVLYHMNREDAGFKRVQGDLVLKIVEGHIGFCQTCPVPRPSGKTFLNPTQGEPKMLYKIEPALNYSYNICIDCIKNLNRNHHLVNRQVMGNHELSSDQFEQFVEIGDSFSFNNTVINLPEDVDIDKFKEELAPGRMVVAKDKLYVSVKENTLRDVATSMWTNTGNMRVGQPSIIVAMGGQNVMLEHKEHETKSVYIPKDSIGVFAFQRTAPEVLGAE
jgi:hypothetical protein